MVVIHHCLLGHLSGSAGQGPHSMYTQQAPGWGFSSTFPGSADAVGVGWQEIDRMVGASATGI